MSGGVIVVLGSPNDETGALSAIAESRCVLAAEQHRIHGYPLLPTGGFGAHFNTTATAHAVYVKRRLVAAGVGVEAILPPVASSSTAEDAALARPVIERRGFDPVVVVTSDFHVERARWYFERELPSRRIVVAGASTAMPESERERLVRHERESLARLRSDG